MLTGLGKDLPKSPQAAGSAGILACAICDDRFTLADVEQGKCVLDSLVCTGCYAWRQAREYRYDCFGKPTQVFPVKKLGYDPQAEECQEFCPDRRICALTCGVRLRELPFGSAANE